MRYPVSLHRACWLMLLGSLIFSALSSAATPEQTKKLQDADRLLKTAAIQFRMNMYNRAKTTLLQAQQMIVELNDVAEFVVPLAGLRDQLQQGYAMLMQKGVRMPPIQLPPLPADAVAAATQQANARTQRAQPLPQANLSFVKHVAPILVTRCARCHINKSEGKLSMATFDSLKTGTPDGPVIMPGKSAGSRLFELIVSGEMPRAGAKVTKPEQTAIAKWIDEGAKFDGPDEKIPMVRLTSAASTAVPAAQADSRPLTMARATGKETVHFSQDIATVLVDTCLECHGGAQPKGKLSMESFATFIQGGQSGPPWSPGKAEESLLVRKLKGQAGARMPLDRTPLADDVIARVGKWISEGGRFDGADPSQSMRRLVAQVRAKSVTHEQLSTSRHDAAREKWRLAVPNSKPITADTKNFYVVGNVSGPALDEVAKAAEEQAVAVARAFRAPDDRPLVKGGMVLFVLKSRYDYSEFGQMVEDRKLPTAWRGHWRFDSSDAYAAVVPPDAESDCSLTGLVGQQVAALYVASLSAGGVPGWFADGTGRAYASRVDPHARRTQEWNRRLGQLIAGGKIETFLKRGLSAEDNDVAGYGFVRTLMSEGGKFSALIVLLRDGEEFEPAFTRIYGRPEAVALAWAKSGK